jgi:hypothetical protein
MLTSARVAPTKEPFTGAALHDGEVFNLSKIRQGLEASRRLHDSLSYLNFAASPDLQIDNTHQRISVTLEIGAYLPTHLLRQGILLCNNIVVNSPQRSSGGPTKARTRPRWEMKQVVIENPVLNSSFEVPQRHFKFDEEAHHQREFPRIPPPRRLLYLHRMEIRPEMKGKHRGRKNESAQ